MLMCLHNYPLICIYGLRDTVGLFNLTQAVMKTAKIYSMRISQLRGLSSVLKIATLAREAGLNPQTLWGKIRRGTELSVVESEAIELALVEKYGLYFDNSKFFDQADD